jgi:hypothetical protein
MEQLKADDELFARIPMLTGSVLERIQPLLDEYLLCSIKIRQLRSRGRIWDDQILLLQRLQNQDERRIRAMIEDGIDPVFSNFELARS